MENPIQYSDLFDPNLMGEVNKLIDKCKEVESTLLSMIAAVKKEASSVGDALSGTSSSTKSGRDTTKEQAANADKLYEAYQRLGAASEYIRNNLEKLLATKERMNKADKLAEVANNSQADSIARLKAQVDLAKLALEGMTEAERKDENVGGQLTAVIRTLEGQIRNYTRSIKAGEAATNSATKANNSQENSLQILSQSYASLMPIIQQTGIDLTQLGFTEKELEKISKYGETANNSLAGSYKQLYAQFNLVTMALHSMSEEMRENSAQGKVLQQTADEIMANLKAQQGAYGRHTLEVGNYTESVTKAMNGLNIASIQVMREMPTLANSVSQFFIAISNNIPIFMTSLRSAAKEMGGFTAALKALIKPAFIFEAVMLIILTILPKVAKAIHEKRKAQKEANEEMEKGVTYAELMAKAEQERYSAVVNETVKLQFLTGVLKDNNRAWEDRIKAAEIMKKEWKEEFENFTTEEMVAGKAAGAIDTLTEALVTQAEARAYLNKIGELSIKLYDLEQERSKARANRIYEETKLDNLRLKQLEIQRQAISDVDLYGETTAKTQAKIVENENAIKKQTEAIEDANAAYHHANRQMQDVENAISSLKDKIKLAGLDIHHSGSDIADSILEIPSYYNDALRAIINNMEDGLQKELALLDLGFKEQREKRMEQQAKLTDMLEKATKDEKARIEAELSNLALAMVAEEQNYLETRRRMLDAFKQAEVEETDPEQELLDSIRMRLEVVRKYQEKKAAMEYSAERDELMGREHTLAEEVALVDKYNEKIIASEKEYWENFKTELEAEGLELTDEYKEVMDKIASLTGKLPSDQTSTRKKRGSKNYRNLVEVGFAMNPLTGEKGENGVWKIKDEYMDFANAVNEALATSMEYMDEWMDKRIEMAELAVEQAEKETNAAKTALDYEMQARANGYANNVELARKEYEEKLAMQRQAIAEQKRLQKIQEQINTAQQIGSLVTATANLWSGYSEIPIVGPALAIAATALMWGSFLAAKIQAANLANQTTYGEGMSEYINYGSSHASGNDVDFGRTKDGRQRKVERGEVIGVINKRNVEKYGVNYVLNLINSLNNGTYEKSKESAANAVFLNWKIGDILRGADNVSTGLKMPFADDSAGLAANYSAAFDGLRAVADLSVLESGVGALVEQGRTRVVQTPEGRIEYRGNNKRIIRNG